MIRYVLIFVIVVFMYLIINNIVRKQPVPVWAWLLFGMVVIYMVAVFGYILTSN